MRFWRCVSLAFALLAATGTTQAQITFRGASSATGPSAGAVAFRAATSAIGGNIVFRAAASAAGTAPTFVAAASASAASGVLTISINRPANTLENDVMIAAIGVSAATPAITAPAGWTLVRQTNNAGPTANALAVYRKVATASEPANYEWTLSTSTGAAGGIQSFRSVDVAAPVDVENGQTTVSGTSHATPSVVTTATNTMLVTAHTLASSRTWTAPAGMTESFDAASIAPNNAAGQSIEGNRQVQAAAGATGAKAATVGGNADAGVTHILALRPALRIALPVGTSQNDVMVAAIAVQPNTAAITPPAGWTPVNRIDNPAATANSLAIYRKVAGATEPSSYLWGVAGATFFIGGIQSFSGVDTATPVDAQGGAATPSALAHTAPSITTTVANTMLVSHHTFASGATWTPPPISGGDAVMVESFDILVPAAGAAGQSLEGARVIHAAIGATAAKIATALANADAGNAHILALRSSGSSIQIARPATAVENDVMIAAIGVTPSSVTITPPSGWTLVRRTNNAGGVTNSLAVYLKIATNAEPGGYYWTFSAAATSVGGIQAYAGVDTGNPINIENGQTTAAAATHATPNVATTVANTMVVTHHAYSSSQNWTPPAAMTESFDQRSAGASATGQSLEGARVVQAVAGATGAKTATAAGAPGSNDFGNTHILALVPLATNILSLATPPGTVSGDIMIASIGFQAPALTITPPAGWISIRRTNNAGVTANSIETFRRSAGASEPAAHDWVFSGAITAAAGGIQSFGGVDTITPIDVENGQLTASALTHATPSINTTVLNTMIVTAHTIASSGTWTPPAGMLESADRANLAVPNAAGQSIELNRVEKGPTGATGVKTATASANADTGNTHILSLRPGTVGATVGGFNAYETATAGGAITGVIKTRIAGAAVSLDIIALNAAKTAIETMFTGTVRVEVLDASNNAGALDANGCRPTWAVIQTLAADPVLLAGDNGRKTISFTQANAYPQARLRVTFPAGAPTATGCSSDAFAIRPSTLGNFSVTDNDWQTAGTNRTLDDVTFTAPISGGKVHKAGRPLTVRADALNGAGLPAVTTNYAGTPTATVAACAGAACTATFGTLALATTFAAGLLNTGVASYNEVGSFLLQLVDSTFSNVDAGDSTALEREITSAQINVGRFVPDNFAVALNVPAFGTACGGGSFTYVGQLFNYATQPVITVTARDFANNTTSLYAGAWWRISNSSITPVTQAARYSAASGTLDVSNLPAVAGDPAVASAGSGSGTLTFSSGATGLLFARTTPVGQFDADISLAINVIDDDGVALATNPALFGQATAGNGIAFSAGKAMRFGRLRLNNASGSPLVALPMLMETQYWNGSSFITNADDGCTTVSAANVGLGNYTGNLNSPETAPSVAGGAFSKGRKTLTMSAPGAANNGSVDIVLNLGTTTTIDSCLTWAVTPTPAGASLSHLRGQWCGAAYSKDPTARATFGTYRGSDEVIHQRENF